MVAALVLTATPLTRAAAQTRPAAPTAGDAGALVPTVLLMTAPPAPGRESEWDLGRGLLAAGWRRDPLGSFVLRRGSGTPRRVVACALDQPTFVVGEITDDGYIRLHDPADPRRHPLWAQFHEGQRVLVSGARGDIPGVIGVRSTHLWRRRPAADAPATTDDLWVDIGATSRAAAERAGVRLLDPVRREFPAWLLGGTDTVVVAPAMAARAGCAAVAAAARGTPTSGETVFVLAAQSAFGYTGLAAAIARLGRVDSVVVVDALVARGLSSPDSPAPNEAVTSRAAPQLRDELHLAGGGIVVAVGVRSLFPGTLVEGVTLRDLGELTSRVAAAAAVPRPRGALLADVIEATMDAPSTDSLHVAAELLARLADEYGVSGHEARVRDAVRAALPPALRSRATVDTAGNLILSLGPDRDTTVFVAHLDEIGYEVKSIAHDGTVALTPRGGFFASLWEGQPALLHFDGEDERHRGPRAGCSLRLGAAAWLPGVFVPRQSATKKQPDAQTAWFGTDSAGLVACGVRPGMSVTGVKTATRLAGTRFTARSIDDRVGCTALLLALRSIDPAKLTHKVIFAWSVREEMGLEGAATLAAAFGTSVHRVYAVDTFVSSDSPLESHRFAYTPIGKGAVVRALDNSSATPPAEVERVVALARRAGIPIQVGTTNGGNDGSELARFGAIDVPLSWPARYSHSPVETIDLVDVDALARLIAALATQ
ncbi:MAG TPA: hypothetical protein VFJ74_12070 [Gemmatimonadaceae bacterium]|nr:hypothetical protein [Gemmatimonadaceae bacterium]